MGLRQYFNSGGPLKQKAAAETEPLLAGRDASSPPVDVLASGPSSDTQQQKQVAKASSLLNPYRLVLVATFFLSVSFVFTATPLLFAFRTMECQDYYTRHNEPPELGDRCAVKEVEAATAESISLMIIFTTVSGFLNLLVTTWEIKRWGVRAALVQQTLWPCARNLCQTVAIRHGFRFGIRLIQGTQLITILGGGAGYMLAANNYITELVDGEERTGAFGVLSGVAMAGTAFGYTVGGMAGDYISPVAPFEITFCLLVCSTLFTGMFLPYIAPAPAPPPGDGTTNSRGGPLACLGVFVPRKLDGQKGRYWGLTLLGFGTFMGVLATSFVPLMLQLTATNRFAFTPSENGLLMSLNSSARAVFLTLAFPRLIARGRNWFSLPSSAPSEPSTTAPSPTPTLIGDAVEDGPSSLPTDAQAFEPTSLLQEVEEPVNVPVSMAPTDKAHGSAFDLVFLKWSMVVDALLTALVGFNTRKEEILLAALVLPLASGTAPACKGVMMELVPPSQRPDALSAISMLETAGFILTGSLFGVVFAWLSDIGKPNFVFWFNGCLALLAGLVLMTVRFPRAPPASVA